MSILVLGGSGQVGFELLRSLALLGSVIAPGRSELDLTDPQRVEEFLCHLGPDLIVNAAAWTAVDAAEEHEVEAYRLNAELPEQLACYAKVNNIRLVHYSSDYVYPGNGTEAWTEESSTAPLSVYGASKLAGDAAIQRVETDHLIFRTSWVYSARGNNFMKTMLRLGKSKPELDIVADQIGAPTPARLIAEVTALALHRNLKSGLYHLAPSGETSWCEFAKEIFRLALKAGEDLALDPENAHPIPTSEYPTPAKRPLNSRMNVSKLEAELGIHLPAWRSQLELTLKEFLN